MIAKIIETTETPTHDIEDPNPDGSNGAARGEFGRLGQGLCCPKEREQQCALFYKCSAKAARLSTFSTVQVKGAR